MLLLDLGSGPGPEIKFPDHDQDFLDNEARVEANTDRRADVPAKEVLNEILRTMQHGQFVIWV